MPSSDELPSERVALDIEWPPYQERVALDIEWLWMLDYDLRAWLDLIRSGNINGAIPSAARWYHEFGAALQRRGLDRAPIDLHVRERVREAAYAALEAHRVQIYPMHPATTGAAVLWAKFLAAEIGMSADEYRQWAERERQRLLASRPHEQP